MDLQFCMEIFLPRKYTEYISLTLSVMMCIGPTIHYNAGHNCIHTYIILQELMNLHYAWIGFLSRRITSLTLSALITMYMYIRTLVQVLLEEANTHSGTVGFAPEKYNEPQLFR